MLRYPVSSLGEICDITSSKRIYASDYVERGVPFYRSKEIIEKHNKKSISTELFITEKRYREIEDRFGVPKVGDLLITAVGTLGIPYVVQKDDYFYFKDGNLIWFRNLNGVDSRYLYHWILSGTGKGALAQTTIGVAQPAYTIANLKDVELPLPPISTQRKIAAILTTYDDLIETNKRRIALLEKMAEEIYREWFVRMRFPGYRSARFVKGVPENWEHKQFGKFCMLKRGYDLPNALVEDGPYPVVASTSIKTFHKHYKVEPPVITTGRSGSLGDVLMTQSRAWPLNTSLYVRDFFGNSPYLVFYTLKSMGLEKFNSGAGVPTLNRNHLNGIPIAVPDKILQQRFEEFVEPLHQQAEGFRVANHTLAKTRDLLLPRLISGKLSVEDLDIQFPPSMEDAA